MRKGHIDKIAGLEVSRAERSNLDIATEALCKQIDSDFMHEILTGEKFISLKSGSIETHNVSAIFK